MSLRISNNIKIIYALNFLIAFYPFAYALGNMAININSLLIILLGFFYFRLDVFKIKINIFFILLFSYFLILIISSTINYLPLVEENILYKRYILKSFYYLRYLLLFLIISKIVQRKLFKFKYLFFTAGFMSSFLALDLIVQYFNGSDLFGITPDSSTKLIDNINYAKYSGFFGDEWVAGGYLRLFSPFFIFIFLIFNKEFKSKYFYFILVPALFIFFWYITFITGNRMPTALFLMCMVLFLLIEKKLRIVLPVIIIVVSVIFTYSIKTNKAIEYNVKSFIGDANQIIFKSKEILNQKQNINSDGEYILAKDSKEEVASSHLKIFKGAITTWQKNKLIGGGYRSFNVNCLWGLNMWCSNHPHNFYLELLVDTGLFGAFIFFIMLIIPIFKFFNFNKKSQGNFERFFYFPFFFIIFVEFFPIKSSGSLFGTGVSTILFLSLAVIYNIKNDISEK